MHVGGVFHYETLSIELPIKGRDRQTRKGAPPVLWDLYQQYQIRQLDAKIDRAPGGKSSDEVARDAVVRLEEKLDRLALISRAMFELLQEAGKLSEEKLNAKIVEIDLRDGQKDGKMAPIPKRCPKCSAMMSPRFGRCLFCGHEDATVQV